MTVLQMPSCNNWQTEDRINAYRTNCVLKFPSTKSIDMLLVFDSPYLSHKRQNLLLLFKKLNPFHQCLAANVFQIAEL